MAEYSQHYPVYPTPAFSGIFAIPLEEAVNSRLHTLKPKASFNLSAFLRRSEAYRAAQDALCKQQKLTQKASPTAEGWRR